MRKGTDFEVSKDVYDRAVANYVGKDKPLNGAYYMAKQDQEKLFSEAIRWGYGLYSCMVREEDGKYICSYWTGDTCD